jgi:hypothetical protein
MKSGSFHKVIPPLEGEGGCQENKLGSIGMYFSTL